MPVLVAGFDMTPEAALSKLQMCWQNKTSVQRRRRRYAKMFLKNKFKLHTVTVLFSPGLCFALPVFFVMGTEWIWHLI